MNENVSEGQLKRVDLPDGMSVTISVMEGTYYHLWTDLPAGKRAAIREGRPAVPDANAFPISLSAQPIYMHIIGGDLFYVPEVTAVRERFLRPVGSEALLPNAYLFAGEITACVRYETRVRVRPGEPPSEAKHHIQFVVDCGLPLEFHFTYDPGSPNTQLPWFRAQEATEGVWVAGLARLGEGFGGKVYQPIVGAVRRVQALGMDPSEAWLGRIQDVPFGYRPPLDPDTNRQEFVFVTFDVLEVGPVTRDP